MPRLRPTCRARHMRKQTSCCSAARPRACRSTTRSDASYPAALSDLRDPPAVLWSRGRLELAPGTVVAIVGTRRATSYGQRMTREIATALARAGACVVSGMALGIDAARAPRRAGRRRQDGRRPRHGRRRRVSARAHARCIARSRSAGWCCRSLAPGARSDAGSFPRRNRIIAALATLTIVVEAPVRSGALITSRHALELGRDVAAVPGSDRLAAESGRATSSFATARTRSRRSPTRCRSPDSSRIARSAPELRG